MIYQIKDKIPKMARTVACIGYFDAVHLGHQALINKTVTLAKERGLPSSLITFDPDPVTFITGQLSHINALEERYWLFEHFGIDNIISVEFSPELLKKEPETFVDELLRHFNMEMLVCGFDFSFGYQGRGKAADLLNYPAYFQVEIVKEIAYQGKKISSSYIRQLLKAGNINLVNQLLGYDYFKFVSIKNKTVKFADNDIVILKDGTYRAAIDNIPLCLRIDKGRASADYPDVTRGRLSIYE